MNCIIADLRKTNQELLEKLLKEKDVKLGDDREKCAVEDMEENEVGGVGVCYIHIFYQHGQMKW